MKKSLFMFIAALFVVCGFNKTFAQVAIPEVPAELKETVDGYVQTLLQDPTNDDVMKAIGKNKMLKKNKEALIAVGYKFLDNNLFGNAIGLAKKVYDMDPQFVPALYLEGDSYFKMGNSNAYGLAATKYEEAKQYDGESLDPYLKLVGVYRYINPDYAIELMQEIKEKKTEDPKINQVLGTLYYQLADTINARTYYNKYFETYPDGQGDVTIQREYVIILFMAKDYQGALTQSTKFLGTNPKDPVLNRIIFLSNYELQRAYVDNVENEFKPDFADNKAKYEATTKAAYDKFYGQYPDSVYQELDYRYKAQYHEGLKDYATAKKAWLLAEKADTANAATQFYLSKCCEKTKEYNDAIAAYKKYMQLAEKATDTNEKFKLARIYYNAANATQEDSLARVKFIHDGDALYAAIDKEMVETGEPTYLAIFWRSRINQLYNKKKPNEIASKHMKEALKRLEDPKFASEDYHGHRAQGYSYLSWFAMEQEDNAAAKDYAQKALTYEEDNALASNVKNYLEILGKW